MLLSGSVMKCPARQAVPSLYVHVIGQERDEAVYKQYFTLLGGNVMNHPDPSTDMIGARHDGSRELGAAVMTFHGIAEVFQVLNQVAYSLGVHGATRLRLEVANAGGPQGLERAPVSIPDATNKTADWDIEDHDRTSSTRKSNNSDPYDISPPTTPPRTAESAPAAEIVWESPSLSSRFYTPLSTGPNSLATVSTGRFGSGVSFASYHSAASFVGSRNLLRRPELKVLKEKDEYAQLLRSRSLWPIEKTVEQDWSGRGQHAKFDVSERKLVDEILEFRDTLGMTGSSVVHKVKCKRILLARKTVFAKKRVTLEQAVDEMANLEQMHHAHIIRLIGSYTIGREVSILMYPVAACNLEEFHHKMLAADPSTTTWEDMARSHAIFSSCLTAAVAYLHSKAVKHMDIKPQNILLRRVPRYYGPSFIEFRLYVTDFGISRSYRDVAAAETDSLTSFTWKYAAPEVVKQERRGLSADIFSLGCVLLELYVIERDIVLIWPFPRPARRLQAADSRDMSGKETGTYFKSLQKLLYQNPDTRGSYHANIEAVRTWMSSSFSNGDIEVQRGVLLHLLPFNGNIYTGTFEALSESPASRPTAQDLADVFGKKICCKGGREPLEAAEAEGSEKNTGTSSASMEGLGIDLDDHIT
ncbi:hypothetical protein OPT61_g9183 [Boeremia exigua]|uniref:Uncharacterized protein n=1 Tax=Boeremia exigua TaxID=749465 RepID=A0ACC2HV69_9PLEO|nr:hypothetical protein OPT61_g9183 [Boeremia exigua]